jgi:hypothetical protein
MAGDKITVPFEIHPDMMEMLVTIGERYRLPDASKALRCLLDYAATNGDWADIFGTVRCRRCA